MRMAISAQHSDIESLVDPRFGRAVWLIIADAESGEWAAIDSRSTAEASGGAGARAVRTVVDQCVDTVITGNVGPNALKILGAAGVSIYQAGNGVTVREAIRRLDAGELQELDAPTVAGHWA
jgi:predicted Fe-Mo cluster-binding NifX family protein